MTSHFSKSELAQNKIKTKGGKFCPNLLFFCHCSKKKMKSFAQN